MSTDQNRRPATAFESKLIPIVREGIEIVKLILFQELRERLARRHAGLDEQRRALLNGALINRMFGITPLVEPLASFTSANRPLVEEELQGLAAHLDTLRIPLTDALRMQWLCDMMENGAAGTFLNDADRLGLLIRERDLPCPTRSSNSYAASAPPAACCNR